MRLRVSILLAALVLVTGVAMPLSKSSARDSDSHLEKGSLDEYLSPVKYEVREITDQSSDMTLFGSEIIDACRGPGVTEGVPGVAELNEVVAVGEKLWQIIEAGRPVVNHTAPLVHALPLATVCWSELESWRPPVNKIYEVRYENGFGMDVVKFRFRVTYTAGGKHDGVGAYLANVTVMPASLEVAWGYTFNADTQVGRAINLGTKSDPIAGLQLLVTWNVKTAFKDITNSETLFLRGDR